MSMRTKRGAAALVAALALGVAACGSDEEPASSGSASGDGGEGAKVALLLPESKTTRYEKQDRPNFERRVKELCANCEVIYSNADQDPSKQQQQAESAITNGAKALVISAVDVQSAGAIVARAKQSQIPVISYGRLVADADLDYYVSIDPFKVGQQQGRALVEALGGGRGKGIVMINGAPTDSNAAPYKRGAHDVLDKAGVKVLKEYDTPDWSPDRAQRQMEQAITSVGKENIDGVYVANDGMASGVIAAMKASGIDPSQVPVTGQDAEAAAIQRILVDEQLMTVYQPIRQIAETAAQLAVPLAQGQQPPDIAKAKVDNGMEQVPSVLLDTIVVDKTNIQDTVIKENFLEVDQICTGRYAAACKEAGIGAT
jgi:D-xylose transport system substrate-binding protein